MLLSSNKDKRTVSTCRNCIGSFCPRSVRTDLRRFARWVFSFFKPEKRIKRKHMDCTCEILLVL